MDFIHSSCICNGFYPRLNFNSHHPELNAEPQACPELPVAHTFGRNQSIMTGIPYRPHSKHHLFVILKFRNIWDKRARFNFFWMALEIIEICKINQPIITIIIYITYSNIYNI